MEAGMLRKASSAELGTLITNFDRLLVALRFGGGASWARGKGDVEMANNLRALKLVFDAPGSAGRGFGVVMNNMALAANKPGVEQHWPTLTADELFTAAVSNARGACFDNPDDDTLHDTLAFRLLNCVLYHIHADRWESAVAFLNEIYADQKVSGRCLATVCSHLSFTLACVGRQPPSSAAVAKGVSDYVEGKGKFKTADLEAVPRHEGVFRIVAQLVLKARDHVAREPIEDEDTGFVADLCAAHCDIGCLDARGFPFCAPNELALWALTFVPRMSTTSLVRLALHAKAGGDASWTQFVDYQLQRAGATTKNAVGDVLVGQATDMYRDHAAPQSAGPKVMNFVLDLSFSMQQDNRLVQCKDSLLNILREHANPKDRLGLVSFANDVKIEFPFQLRGDEGSPNCQKMMSIIQNLYTRGMTAFYEAVAVGCAQLHSLSEPTSDKWLVALTDGADNCSAADAHQRALRTIASVPKLHVAIITVGTGIDMGKVKSLLNAAEGNGSNALLVQANNQADIAKAFEKVSAAMSAGVSEVL